MAAYEFPAGAAAGGGGGGSSFCVLTWNLRGVSSLGDTPFSTWSGGKVTGNDTYGSVDALLKTAPLIGMALQECGGLFGDTHTAPVISKEWGEPWYTYKCSWTATAPGNDRCSLGIALSCEFTTELESGKYSSSDFSFVRPLLMARGYAPGAAGGRGQPFLFGCLHAPSGAASVAIRASYIEEAIKVMRYQAGRNPWILLGDFNRVPTPVEGAACASTGSATHTCGKELDYCYHGNWPGGLVVEAASADAFSTSDHIPVVFKFTY